MAANTLCDGCHQAEHDVQVIMRRTGDVQWLCIPCWYGTMEVLVDARRAAEAEATTAEPVESEIHTVEAEPAEMPAPRPRLIDEDATPAAGEVGAEPHQPVPQPAGDECGVGGMEPRPSDGGGSDAPPATARGAVSGG